jgi:hypothetical protein
LIAFLGLPYTAPESAVFALEEAEVEKLLKRIKVFMETREEGGERKYDSHTEE